MIRIIQEEVPSKSSTLLSTDASLLSLASVRQVEAKKLMALLRGELDQVVMYTAQGKPEQGLPLC